MTMHDVTGVEVTRPDGSRFVSMTDDLARLRLVYRAAEGYSLRLVTGYATYWGFTITQ